MPSNKSWLDGPTPRDHAQAKVWQGAMVFVMGATTTAVTHFAFGFVWLWLVGVAVLGFFWMLVGLITLLTGYE
jgi:fatty acid desaturase